LTDVTLEVDLGDRSYPIHIGDGLLGRGELLRDQVRGSQVAVITNDVVGPLYLPCVAEALAGIDADVYTLPDGEQHKNLESYGAIMDFLMERRHNRSTTLVALGGGVVGDITGFVAATFQRGVAFVQVPTTLLAQVDSSVGGKTAINHPRGKNMIGAFYQPRCVIADTTVLNSLGDRELRAGLAEVLKYGVIADGEFFDWLESNANALLSREPEALAVAIRRSCEIKAAVVAEDERESGIRAILNYGHTFGHAIETLTGYGELLHGEAVAAGMVMAADLSARQGWLTGSQAKRIKAAVEAFGLPVVAPSIDPDDMLSAMSIDKKVVNGRLRLVLSRAIGEAAVTEDVDELALRATLAAGEALCDR
jgi:3-dehydroquinate synthase